MFVGAVSEINDIILKHGGMINQTRGSTISIEAPLDYAPQPQVIPAVSEAHQELLPTVGAVLTSQQPNLSRPPPRFSHQNTAAVNLQPSSAASLSAQVRLISHCVKFECRFCRAIKWMLGHCIQT